MNFIIITIIILLREIWKKIYIYSACFSTLIDPPNAGRYVFYTVFTSFFLFFFLKFMQFTSCSYLCCLGKLQYMWVCDHYTSETNFFSFTIWRKSSFIVVMEPQVVSHLAYRLLATRFSSSFYFYLKKVSPKGKEMKIFKTSDFYFWNVVLS